MVTINNLIASRINKWTKRVITITPHSMYWTGNVTAKTATQILILTNNTGSIILYITMENKNHSS